MLRRIGTLSKFIRPQAHYQIKMLSRSSLPIGISSTLPQGITPMPRSLFTPPLRMYSSTTQQSLPYEPLVPPGKEKVVGVWLLASALSVLVIILVGGYTRIKNAGLSMTYWKPLSLGFPRGAQQWEQEYKEYQKFPEYQIHHTSLQEFKFIFFMEWFHRMLARSMGLVFVLPLGYFWARGYIRGRLRKILPAVAGLGGVQAVIGWWMVKSGLDKRQDYQMRAKVSTYRLVTHLSIALTIYSTLLWQAMNLLLPPTQPTPGMVDGIQRLKAIRKMKIWGAKILLLVVLNLFSGALVAGIEGGKVFNTWPDMNGGFLPGDYLQGGWKSLFENRGTVQFNHRMLGYATYSVVSILLYKSRSLALSRRTHRAIRLMAVVVNYQLTVGVLTLLSMVDPYLASLHQFGGVAMLSTSLLFIHSLRSPKSVLTRAK